jgi:hypothetical protein
MAGFGVNFVPGGDQQQGPEQGGIGQTGGITPQQQAVKFLSLRLPKFSGPGGLAPPSLLGGPGSGGMPSGSVGPMPGIPGMQPGGFDPMSGASNPLLEALMRLARMRQGGMGGPPPMGPAPGPRFTPTDPNGPGQFTPEPGSGTAPPEIQLGTPPPIDLGPGGPPDQTIHPPEPGMPRRGFPGQWSPY